jgi:hypothetical protein
VRGRGSPHRTRPAADPFGHGLESSLAGGTSYPTAGRARLFEDAEQRRALDVLWWAYPLVGPGPERLLVLAADAAAVTAQTADGAQEAGTGSGSAVAGADFERIAPGFALHTEFSGADGLARQLPDILPSMNPRESARIVAQVPELGYPVLEISQHDRVPVAPDWGVPRRVERQARRRAAAAATAADPGSVPAEDLAPDLEYAAVREHMEFLDEVSGRIGTSLDLSRTVREVSAAVVPRFTDVAGTCLREQVLAGEGFPDGPPDVTTMWYRVAVEHTDEPGRRDDVVPAGESMPFPAQTPFFPCVTTGEPVLVPRISEEMGNAVAAQFPLLDMPTGAPLGVGGVAFEEVRVPVSAGDRLVLCTDGLVEVRGQDIGAGLAALCENAAHPAASMDDACDTIIRALNPRGGHKDDAALLMALLSGIPREDVADWELEIDPQEVGRARLLLRGQLRAWDPAAISETAELLVGEVVTNAVRHAHTRRVGLRLVRAGALLCEVGDDDHAVPVLLGAHPTAEGGRGLRIVSRLARERGAGRGAHGKAVWFEQPLPRRRR